MRDSLVWESLCHSVEETVLQTVLHQDWTAVWPMAEPPVQRGAQRLARHAEVSVLKSLWLLPGCWL